VSCADGVVCRLGADDHEPICSLWRRAGLHTIRPQGRDSREAFARQIERGLLTILGLEDDGKLVGVVLASHDGRKGWINRLAIDPDYRRRGLATGLVEAAEAALRAQGIDVVAALVESDNTASTNLFLRLGYLEHDPGIHYLSKRSSHEA
jgi:N-acetylglutamate synthase